MYEIFFLSKIYFGREILRRFYTQKRSDMFLGFIYECTYVCVWVSLFLYRYIISEWLFWTYGVSLESLRIFRVTFVTIYFFLEQVVLPQGSRFLNYLLVIVILLFKSAREIKKKYKSLVLLV